MFSLLILSLYCSLYLSLSLLPPHIILTLSLFYSPLTLSLVLCCPLYLSLSISLSSHYPPPSSLLSAAPCRNCGNVFCGSCCDQKIPVPSQQLFEPSRVCKTCFSSLQAATTTATPSQMELEKPITASSN